MSRGKGVIRLLLISGVILLSALFSFSAPRAEEVTPGAAKAAQDGLPSFLAGIPAGAETDFGFSLSDPLDQAVLGEPFSLSVVSPSALQAYQPGDPVDSLLTPTGTWYFPVVLGGQYRAILTVARMDGQWKAVALGRALLARKLQRLREQWPSSGGYDPRLIVSPQARQYLFTVPSRGVGNLTPLAAEISDGGKKAGDYGTLDDLSDTVGKILPAVNQNLQGGGRASPGAGRPDETD